jgi:Protein of unknown function (DUF3129).
LSSSEFIPLNVSNNVPGTNGLSQAKFENFTINVQLPEDLNCTGGEMNRTIGLSTPVPRDNPS